MKILRIRMENFGPYIDEPIDFTELNEQRLFLLEGKTVEALKGGHFRIELDNGHEVLGHLSGKMRKHHIRILPGDRVQVEVSAYDLTRGRITYRYK